MYKKYYNFNWFSFNYNYYCNIKFAFLAKKPIDLPPFISIELIQITDKTNIPFAPKAKKIIEKIKKRKKKDCF